MRFLGLLVLTTVFGCNQAIETTRDEGLVSTGANISDTVLLKELQGAWVNQETKERWEIKGCVLSSGNFHHYIRTNNGLLWVQNKPFKLIQSKLQNLQTEVVFIKETGQ